MRKYAENTEVPIERSKAEIERILIRYGAEQFMYGTSIDKAMVAFTAQNKHVRFVLPMPDPDDERFKRTPMGRVRKGEVINKEYAQEIRRRWRALALSIKGKLEAVESGIMTFEQEFMAHIVLPNQQTVGELMLPQIEEAYLRKKMPKLLSILD